MTLPAVPSLVTEVHGTSAGPVTATQRLGGDGVLVPLLSAERAVLTDQLRVAAALARTAEVGLYVFSPYTGTHRSVPATSDLTGDDERALLEWASEHVPPGTDEWTFGHTRELVGGILECVGGADVDSLVVPSGSDTGRFRRGLVERLAVRADCDVLTVNGRRGYEAAPSILLAVADGPHSGLATDVAARVAADCDAWVDVLHVVPEDAPARTRERAQALVDAAVERIGRPDSTTPWLLEADDVAGAIAEQSAYYAVTVVGAPTAGRLRQFVFGSTNRAIRSDARSVVLSARVQSAPAE